MEIRTDEVALLRTRLAHSTEDVWRKQARDALEQSDIKAVKELLKHVGEGREPELSALRRFVRIDGVNRWHEGAAEALASYDVRVVRDYLTKGRRICGQPLYLMAMAERIKMLDAATLAQGIAFQENLEKTVDKSEIEEAIKDYYMGDAQQMAQMAHHQMAHHQMGHHQQIGNHQMQMGQMGEQKQNIQANQANGMPEGHHAAKKRSGGVKGMPKSRSQPVYCVCRSTDTSKPMIQCDRCSEWYHMVCIGVDEMTADDISEYVCGQCRDVEAILKRKQMAIPVIDEQEDAFDRKGQTLPQTAQMQTVQQMPMPMQQMQQMPMPQQMQHAMPTSHNLPQNLPQNQPQNQVNNLPQTMPQMPPMPQGLPQMPPQTVPQSLPQTMSSPVAILPRYPPIAARPITVVHPPQHPLPITTMHVPITRPPITTSTTHVPITVPQAAVSVPAKAADEDDVMGENVLLVDE